MTALDFILCALAVIAMAVFKGFARAMAQKRRRNQQWLAEIDAEFQQLQKLERKP